MESIVENNNFKKANATYMSSRHFRVPYICGWRSFIINSGLLALTGFILNWGQFQNSWDISFQRLNKLGSKDAIITSQKVMKSSQ